MYSELSLQMVSVKVNISIFKIGNIVPFLLILNAFAVELVDSNLRWMMPRKKMIFEFFNSDYYGKPHSIIFEIMTDQD